MSISPVRGVHDQLVGVSAIVRDIGARLEAERKLRQNEEQIRRIFEHAPFGMFVARADGHIIQANPALCRMLGYSEPELLSVTWAELTHPDDLDASFERMERLFEQPSLCLEAEKRFLNRTGTIVWAHVKVQTLPDADGNPVCFVAHLDDITERKRKDQALQESEKRFRSMAESFPTMMWLSDETGAAQYVNSAYREFAGASLQPSKLDDWQALVHPEDAPNYLAATAKHSQTTRPFKPRLASAARMGNGGGWLLTPSRAGLRAVISSATSGCAPISPTANKPRRLWRAARPNSGNSPRTFAKCFGLCCRLRARSHTLVLPTNRSGEEVVKVFTKTACPGFTRSIPTTGRGPSYRTRNISPERRWKQSTASAHRISRKNGSAIAAFPFAMRAAT